MTTTMALRQSRAVRTKVQPALEAPAGLLDPLALRLDPESPYITPTPSVILV